MRAGHGAGRHPLGGGTAIDYHEGRGQTMDNPRLPAPLLDGDFEAIEAAVMETEKGRWFLAEFARRHRVADTETVLVAVGRLGSCCTVSAGRTSTVSASTSAR